MNYTRKLLRIPVLVLLLAAIAISAQDATPISVGDTVEGTLQDGEAVRYSFEASAGDVVEISMSSEDFDTFLFLEDSEQLSLTSNDDGGEGTNSLIRGYAIPEDGTYIILADSFDPTASGSFTLSLQMMTLTTLEMGDSTTEEFTAETDSLTFAFEGSTNQVVNVTVDSGNVLDTRVELFSPFDFVIASNDDANDTVDPALNDVVLDADGQYLIVVSKQNPNATLTGEITVSISEAELTSLEDGPAELAYDLEINEYILTFEGTADEVVRLTIEIDEEETNFRATPFLELSQNGETFSNFNMSGLERFVVDVPIPADGPVTLSTQAFSEITLTITLTRPE